MAKAEVGRAMASCCLSFLGLSTSPPKHRAKEKKGQSLHEEFLLQFLGSVEGDLALSHCEPVALQRLACCSKMLHETIGREDLVKKRAEDWALNMQCSQLEHLAFNLAVRELCALPNSHHVLFGYGGGKTPLASAVPFLRTAADIAKRFPRAKVHVDAHAGVYAPSHRIADKCSQARAQSIRQHLLAQGVSATQISSTAWGKYVSAFWAEQDDRVARAEVYLCLDAVHIPDKPDYYHTSSSLGHEEPHGFHIYNRDGHFWLMPEEELEAQHYGMDLFE